MIIVTKNLDITISGICNAHSGVELHGDFKLGSDGGIFTEDIWCPASTPGRNDCWDRWAVQIETDDGVIIK